MSPPIQVRAYDPACDRAAVRALVIQLQDDERALHPSRRPGESVADDYMPWLEASVREQQGDILVAEAAGRVVGYTSYWIEVDICPEELPESNRHGYIQDLCVDRDWRGQGIAGRLLAAAEQALSGKRLTYLRLGVLANNAPALSAYAKQGFAPYEIVMEKRFSEPSGQ